jgi:hypothetical protein
LKIIKAPEAFKPVSIVLETQEEVNWVYELFGNIGGGGPVRKFVDNVYYGLEGIAQDNEDLKVFESNFTIQIKSGGK